ncbi:hypothetical protein ACFQ46_07870 [Kineococcus sp. GCM10028916]|uniref:exo-rhamnogalacturonan lyase family protein n=1 Tax=Kineococcus sp. GCM10028916 TaxID=3273394 RepID=UPI003628EAE0
MTAWVAARTRDPVLARRAWSEFHRGGEFLRDEGFARVHLEPPEVFRAVDEAPTLSTNDAAQFSLAAIANLALVGDDLGQVGTTQGADPRGDRRPEKGAAGQRE